MTGGVTPRAAVARMGARDRSARGRTFRRSRPAPAPADRPRSISVTEVDRLKADPFAFYARRILRLVGARPVDADPSAAWRGSAVHKVLEDWMKEDDCDPARLRPRAEALLSGRGVHPLMRALWQPRLLEAIAFIAARVGGESRRRTPAAGRGDEGRSEIAGVTLRGKADRIDQLADGSLAIVDYKTGKPPSAKAMTEGFALQLGLLGLIAERGGFEGIDGIASCLRILVAGAARRQARLCRQPG